MTNFDAKLTVNVKIGKQPRVENFSKSYLKMPLIESCRAIVAMKTCFSNVQLASNGKSGLAICGTDLVRSAQGGNII